MLPSGEIFELKIHQNAFAAGPTPWTPLGSLQRPSKPPSWFSGARLAQQGREGRKGEGKQGSVPPLLFFTISPIELNWTDADLYNAMYLLFAGVRISPARGMPSRKPRNNTEQNRSHRRRHLAVATSSELAWWCCLYCVLGNCDAEDRRMYRVGFEHEDTLEWA